MDHPNTTSDCSPRLSHSLDMTHQRLDDSMEDGKMNVELKDRNGKELVPREKKPEDTTFKGRSMAFLHASKEILLGNKLNILLIFIPFG